MIPMTHQQALGAGVLWRQVVGVVEATDLCILLRVSLRIWVPNLT